MHAGPVCLVCQIVWCDCAWLTLVPIGGKVIIFVLWILSDFSRGLVEFHFKKRKTLATLSFKLDGTIRSELNQI